MPKIFDQIRLTGALKIAWLREIDGHIPVNKAKDHECEADQSWNRSAIDHRVFVHGKNRSREISISVQRQTSAVYSTQCGFPHEDCEHNSPSKTALTPAT